MRRRMWVAGIRRWFAGKHSDGGETTRRLMCHHCGPVEVTIVTLRRVRLNRGDTRFSIKDVQAGTCRGCGRRLFTPQSLEKIEEDVRDRIGWLM